MLRPNSQLAVVARKFVYVASIFFSGTSFRIKRCRLPLRLELRGFFSPRFLALWRFSVEFLCLGGRTPSIGERNDRNIPFVRPDAQSHTVASLHGFSRFDVVAVQIDFSTAHGRRRHCAGLKEARCPQPFVDSYAFVFSRQNQLSSRRVMRISPQTICFSRTSCHSEKYNF